MVSLHAKPWTRWRSSTWWCVALPQCVCCSKTTLFRSIHRLQVIAKKVSSQNFFLVRLDILWFVQISYHCRKDPGMIMGFRSSKEKTHHNCHENWQVSNRWSMVSSAVVQKLHMLSSNGKIPFQQRRSLVFNLPNSASHIIISTLGVLSFARQCTPDYLLQLLYPWLLVPWQIRL